MGGPERTEAVLSSRRGKERSQPYRAPLLLPKGEEISKEDRSKRGPSITRFVARKGRRKTMRILCCKIEEKRGKGGRRKSWVLRGFELLKNTAH